MLVWKQERGRLSPSLIIFSCRSPAICLLRFLFSTHRATCCWKREATPAVNSAPKV